ncbi:MAG: RNA 2',3'-cyclic phosphodiesterase [Methanocalculus sp. MSAO_Arc2]|uniref:RNA 2',3'-cyclic phosphodiesterase n=1 Tax=Methanocalculus sp. MSAO_Arc2 TaxID=2293855 RepID=UPI000FED4976|nr:MAG: RNA 2',3'-cyclic phosphodiesterase [Methanocalculus sp. MSAO_Arc2]
MVRLFVAIDLVESIRERLSELQMPLGIVRGRLTIVNSALLHITLKFLGEVPEKEIPRVISALQSLHYRPYRIEINKISSNNPRRPRVIWAQINDQGETATLAELIDAALEPLGIPRETRPFQGHITIARVKEFHPDIPEAIAPFTSFRAGHMEVARFSLKKSTLTPKGPIYETIAEVFL